MPDVSANVSLNIPVLLARSELTSVPPRRNASATVDCIVTSTSTGTPRRRCDSTASARSRFSPGPARALVAPIKSRNIMCSCLFKPGRFWINFSPLSSYHNCERSGNLRAASQSADLNADQFAPVLSTASLAAALTSDRVSCHMRSKVSSVPGKPGPRTAKSAGVSVVQSLPSGRPATYVPPMTRSDSGTMISKRSFTMSALF